MTSTIRSEGTITMTNKVDPGANPAAPFETDNQTGELTETQLSEVTGGSSQSTDAGKARTTISDFHITKKTDATSPNLF
jgi:hypothetical protein